MICIVLRSQKRLAHLEMQLLAMRRHSLRGAVGALEGLLAAFRQLHGLLGDNMSTRHPHWGFSSLDCFLSTGHTKTELYWNSGPMSMGKGAAS
jgi:hypothetical protein